MLCLVSLPVGVVPAASVGVQLESGNFGCCLDISDPVSISGSISNSVTSQPTASAEAIVTTGVMRASAETNAWDDGSPNLDFGQARATMNVTFTNTDDMSAFEIASGEIGLAYDASYIIDQQNAASGSVQFQLRLDAILRDDTNAIIGGVRRAWVNHIVSFDKDNIFDNVPDTPATAPNLKTEQNGGVVEAFTGFDGISGTLSFASLMLDPGDTLQLSLLLFVKAIAGEESGVTDFSMFPSAKVDAENTVQLFFNNPGLESDAQDPLVWPSSPTVVPVPASAWLFGSALGFLGWVRRKKVHKLAQVN
jgi:hypothetical protein